MEKKRDLDEMYQKKGGTARLIVARSRLTRSIIRHQERATLIFEELLKNCSGKSNRNKSFFYIYLRLQHT